jgi:hypothetical protein
VKKKKSTARELLDFFITRNPRTGEEYVAEAIHYEDVPDRIRGPFALAIVAYLECLLLITEGEEGVRGGKFHSLNDETIRTLAKRDRKGKSGFQKLRERRAAIAKRG